MKTEQIATRAKKDWEHVSSKKITMLYIQLLKQVDI